MIKRKIISFDVFDTLITRRTATPLGIFSIMQEKISKCEDVRINDHVKKNFAVIRVNAEKVALRTSDNIVSIEEIYNVIGLMNHLSIEKCKLLKALEIKTEYENCIGINENISLLKKLKNEKKVFLISDMYLHGDILKKMLLKVDSVFSDIPLIVSCDHNRTKSRGDLYDFFLNSYNVNPGDWTHYGDNELSDYRMVKQIGGHAVIYQKNRINCYLYNGIIKNQYDFAYQIIDGAIRNSIDDTRKSEFNIGVGIGGPILYGYTLWIIENAVELRVKDLFFLSRDGYLLKKIADFIINTRHLNMRTHYLYGSRVTWYLPALCEDKDKVVDWIRDVIRFDRWEQICDLFGITIDEIKAYLSQNSIDCKYSGLFSRLERLFVADLIARNKELIEKLQKRWSIKKKDVISYLQQEIGSLERFAFVDLQGTGFSQKCLSDLISHFNDNRVITFYFSFNPEQMELLDKNIFYTYINKAFPCMGITEALGRAPHGQTIGYQYSDNWVPIINNSDKDYPDGKYYNDYEEGVLAFTTFMETGIKPDAGQFVKYNCNLLDRICTQPETDLQKFIGDMPFEVEYSGGKVKKFAPELSNRDIEKIFIEGRGKCRNYEGACLDFSILRASEDQMKLIKKSGNFVNIKKIKVSDYMINLKGNFAIYGAGKIGREVYRELIERKDTRVVAWVDKAFLKLKKYNSEIKSIEFLKEVHFDYIVIAIRNKNARVGIRKILSEMGIDDRKMI